MRKFLNYFFKIFVNYFCSIWIGLACSFLLFPIKLFFKTDILVENIIYSILLTLGGGISLFVLNYRTGYQNKKPLHIIFAVSMLFLFAIQHLITFKLNFYGPHFAGGAQYLAEAIFTPNQEFSEISQSHIHLCLILLQLTFYFPLSFLGNLCGAKAHLHEFEQKNK